MPDSNALHTSTASHNEVDRIRPPRSLEVTPAGGEEVTISWGKGTYLKAFETTSTALAVALLELDGVSTVEDLASHLQQRADLAPEEALDVALHLHSEGFGQEQEPSEAAGLWERLGWSDAASVFRSALDTRWVHDYRGNPIAMVRDAEGQNVGAPDVAPSPAWQAYARVEISLPDPAPIDRPFSDVFAARRTKRHFRTASTTLEDVATIARWTFGRQANDPGRFVSHTYINDGPCVGFFVFDTEVANIDLSGFGALDGRFVVTVYNAAEHRLRLVSAGDDIDQWADMLWTQRYGEGAGFALVLGVDVRNFLHKYPIARSYNWSATDTGSFMHTATLVATGLGLGVFQTPAMDDALVCSMLKIDPAEVHPYYLALFGR